jgi:hypothetical protein
VVARPAAPPVAAARGSPVGTHASTAAGRECAQKVTTAKLHCTHTHTPGR